MKPVEPSKQATIHTCMGKLSFPVLSLTWLTNMAAMVFIAPVGGHPRIFALLFCLGYAQMILMIRTFPGDLETGRALRHIFVLGLVARLFFLAYPEGNDVYRYVWEGHIQNFGYNPFKHPPDSTVLSDIAHGDLHPIWRKINHPEIVAIYPPAVQLLFRLLAWMNPTPFFFKL